MLSNYYEDRVILETEDPGENEENFEYWLHRESFHRNEAIKLDRKYKNRWINDPDHRQEEEHHGEKEFSLRKRFLNNLENTLFKKMSPKRQFEDLSYLLTTSLESWTPSTSKTTTTRHRPVDIHATSNTNVTKYERDSINIRRIVANTMNTNEGNERLRRKSKIAYRIKPKTTSLAQCQSND